MLENFSMQQKCTHISPEKLAWPPRKFWAASGPGVTPVLCSDLERDWGEGGQANFSGLICAHFCCSYKISSIYECILCEKR